ncbi:MAG: hypothetical protein RBR59_09015 [Sulfurimonadaceae bacterium]|nr:hypothetical protein [Sulfurimonadaceae bacterium]
MRYLKTSIVTLLILSFVIFIAVGIYQEATKTGAKSVRMTCHNKTTVFEKVERPELIEEFQENIKHSHLTVRVRDQRAKYATSELFNYISIDDVLFLTQQAIKKHQGDLNPMKQAVVDVLIYENDREDPGKKTLESKLYAGYLVFNFLLDETLVYKIQLDFMNKEAKDVPERIECAIESLFTL